MKNISGDESITKELIGGKQSISIISCNLACFFVMFLLIKTCMLPMEVAQA